MHPYLSVTAPPHANDKTALSQRKGHLEMLPAVTMLVLQERRASPDLPQHLIIFNIQRLLFHFNKRENSIKAGQRIANIFGVRY